MALILTKTFKWMNETRTHNLQFSVILPQPNDMQHTTIPKLLRSWHWQFGRIAVNMNRAKFRLDVTGKLVNRLNLFCMSNKNKWESIVSNSVIVARKGLGDMAVSSSVGSNIFDVCVGSVRFSFISFIHLKMRRTEWNLRRSSRLTSEFISALPSLSFLFTFPFSWLYWVLMMHYLGRNHFVLHTTFFLFVLTCDVTEGTESH